MLAALETKSTQQPPLSASRDTTNISFKARQVCIARQLECMQYSWLNVSNSSPPQERNWTRNGVPTTTQHGGNRPRTDAQCISNILELLSYDFLALELLHLLTWTQDTI